MGSLEGLSEAISSEQDLTEEKGPVQVSGEERAWQRDQQTWKLSGNALGEAPRSKVTLCWKEASGSPERVRVWTA
jgi:hypothetical protein